MKARAFALTALCFLFIFASPLKASPLELYGFSSRSISMGGAETANADDYSALFYNPGRLCYAKQGAGVHFLASFDDVEINLRDRPRGYDVPTDIYNAFPMDMEATKMYSRYVATSELVNQRSDTKDDPNLYALTAGILYNFSLDWFSIGAAISLPLNDMVGADFHYVDEREQFFSNKLNFQLLNRRAKRPSFMAGVGFRPLDWLGFGISANGFGNIVTKTKMFVPDAFEQSSIHLQARAEVKYAVAAIAGIYIEPVEWFGFGFTFRDKTYMEASETNELQFWNFELYEGEPITVQKFKYAFSYTPRSLNWGLKFDIKNWTIAADVTWEMWSDFRPEIREANDTGFGDLPFVQGGKGFWPISLIVNDRDLGTNFRDTFKIKAGVEFRALSWLEVRAGGGYRQSPVQTQDGRTNYVDNNRVDCALGASFKLPWVKGLSFDFHLQFLALIERNQWKSHTSDNPIIDEFPDSRNYKTDEYIESSRGLQTNNPGWPGYRSKGFLGSAGAGLTYEF